MGGDFHFMGGGPPHPPPCWAALGGWVRLSGKLHYSFFNPSLSAPWKVYFFSISKLLHNWQYLHPGFCMTYYMLRPWWLTYRDAFLINLRCLWIHNMTLSCHQVTHHLGTHRNIRYHWRNPPGKGRGNWNIRMGVIEWKDSYRTLEGALSATPWKSTKEPLLGC